MVKRPTTGSFFVVGGSRYSGKSACVGVRCRCIFGVAEVGVGYAVLLGYVDVVFNCGVAIGVEVGNEADEDALGMPKPCSDELPVIGVGVECR